MKSFFSRIALLISLSIVAFGLSQSQAQPYVRNLKTENRINPLGIDARQPRFSWQLAGQGRDILQTAYEVQVRENNNVVWESGKVSSDSSTQIAYRGGSLK